MREVSNIIKTRGQDLSLLVKKYAQDLQNSRNRYKHLDPNDMHFDCVNSTDEILSKRTEEKRTRNENDKHNNCGINTRKNNKSANENASKQNNEKTSKQNSKNTSEQNKTHTTNTARVKDNTYLHNPLLMLLG